ncbi:SAM hydrolase/SAM-dependent halogenase family protein [Candidatus Electrothrix sp.]|uniref:SAM hydrolase/SAM-dependent halogenase family protein n=2 Tax=Candidatus Electrothrix sp. TaxID=2170559 RepID=UPI0040567A5D
MPVRASGLISLTTDFGLHDPYVGQMKGAILQRHPVAQLVDLSHAIPRQDILGAALVLHSSYAFFPAGTVHLVVVDPGVGSQRRILAAEAQGHYFVAPDNGTFSLLLRDQLVQRVYLVEERGLFAETVSTTFHGRDIMGPIAAALASGMPISTVGPEVLPASCVCLEIPVAQVAGQKIMGQILQIDHFGNIRTTIRQTDLRGFVDPQQCQVMLSGQQIKGIHTTYAEAGPGDLVALIDSAGYLEIAVNMGNAAEHLQCGTGDAVEVTSL